MKIKPLAILVVTVTVLYDLLLLAAPISAAGPGQAQAPTDDAVAARVAELSDEGARKLLIEELEKSSGGDPATQTGRVPGATLENILEALNAKSDASQAGTRDLLDAAPGFLPDLSRAFLTLSPNHDVREAMKNLGWVLFYLLIGLVIEQLFFRLVIRKRFVGMSTSEASTVMSTTDKIEAGLVRGIPYVLRILVFFSASYLLYVAFSETDSPQVQFTFLAILVCITIVRVLAIFSRLLFSPRDAVFRLVPMDCQLAGIVNGALLITVGYIFTIMTVAVILNKLGALETTIKILFILASTILLGTTAVCIFLLRGQVHDAIVDAAGEFGDAPCWGRKQFAAIWHLLAIVYLIALWVLNFNDMVDPDIKSRGAFILSFFVLPIWLICDKLLQWLVKYSLSTLKISTDRPLQTGQVSEEEQRQYQQGKATLHKTLATARIALVVILLVWIASLWDIHIPIFSRLSSVLFDTLII
ncbi:MAG: hypothetical protein ACK5PS_17415, partial [Desulfopila sp.]